MFFKGKCIINSTRVAETYAVVGFYFYKSKGLYTCFLIVVSTQQSVIINAPGGN